MVPEVVDLAQAVVDESVAVAVLQLVMHNAE